MVSSPRDRVQRGHAFGIVDEADSVLIDEARTPLIISGLSGAPSEVCDAFAEIAARLDPEENVVLDEKRRTVYETEAGLAKVEKMLGGEVYADLSGATANRLRQALRARFLFKADHDYVVDGGEVKIVDAFTGRLMEAAAIPTASIRQSRRRSMSRSSPRRAPSRPSRCRTTSACTGSSPA